MGEARRRREANPSTYGRVPKAGRGLVMCAPTSVDLNNRKLELSGGLDPHELRLSLLFWDKLAWPTSNIIHVSGGMDEEFLISEGVLTRPRIVFSGVWDGAASAVATQAEAFKQLESREPGSWAIAQGVNSLLIEGGALQAGRSALVELVRAIPIPDKAVPLAEVMELKHRRADELLALRFELDSFYSSIEKSGDPSFELQRSVQRVDTVCADLLKVSSEWKFPIHLADVKASFEINGSAAVSGALGYFVGEQVIQMPTVGAIVGAALSVVKLSGDIVKTKVDTRRSSHPYRYVCSIHDELFRGF